MAQVEIVDGVTQGITSSAVIAETAEDVETQTAAVVSVDEPIALTDVSGKSKDK